VKKISNVICIGLFVASVGWAAHYNPPHTDGIEPYYPPQELADYLKTIPEADALFAKEGEMDWWIDARFAAFICWGPSSMLECSLGWGRRGPRPGHSSDGTVTKGIPQEIYDNQYKQFSAPDFDADAWVRLVRDSGAKYLVWLTKHHDGFCMFDTKLTDYRTL
jgi:alpha-L-fucosidase